MKFDILEFVGARKKVDAKNASLNPYNQLDKYKGKFTKHQMNDILNGAREYLVKIHGILLDEMRKDRSVSSDEIKEFSRVNPLTWPPQKVKQAIINLDKMRPELSRVTKLKSWQQ